jgi:hypothetical protein
LALGTVAAALKEEMQVGLNTLYIKVLMMQSVTLVKADTDDHEFACVQVKTLMGRGDIIKTSLEIFNTRMRSFE